MHTLTLSHARTSQKHARTQARKQASAHASTRIVEPRIDLTGDRKK